MFCNTREAVRHLQATLLERGFSVVALSGELTQNERTQALQALRDGRARVCVATDVAARGIDLPNLDLVIHADLPNDPEVMQHRSGRTGRAGRKGVSIILVPPARKRRAEVLLNLAGIDAVWGTAPQPDEIRKLDQERMLKDALFADETTPEDLVLAQALLAERSAEDIAAALARLYRARLPSPEDILDPGRAVAGPARIAAGKGKAVRRAARIARRAAIEEGKIVAASRHGRRQRLVPRLDRQPQECGSALAAADDLPPRRHRQVDIGAIRIMDTTTEFEISARAAESFAVKIRRPDKEDNIRIEALDRSARRARRSREGMDAEAARQKRKGPDKPAFDKKPRYDTKRPYRDEQAHAGKPRHESGASAKPAFGKKKKKKFRG